MPLLEEEVGNRVGGVGDCICMGASLSSATTTCASTIEGLILYEVLLDDDGGCDVIKLVGIDDGADVIPSI